MVVVPFLLFLVSAALAVPSAVLGYLAAQGLAERPWERRTGPFGAIALGGAGVVVLVSAVLGAVGAATGGSLSELRFTLLAAVGSAGLLAVVLLILTGARGPGAGATRTASSDRSAQAARASTRRSLTLLIGGAALCGTAILLAV
jgi:hypothetical protein